MLQQNQLRSSADSSIGEDLVSFHYMLVHCGVMSLNFFSSSSEISVHVRQLSGRIDLIEV
jgi:hypothetical protein